LFLADAGPYARVEDKRGLLAERMEELVADEHSGWLDARARSEGRSVN
jgi:hypothetical protein